MTMTSVEWWERTRGNTAALADWLLDQHRGERTAAARILALRDRYAARDSRGWRLLTVIARQEARHAEWVAGLLAARGLAATAPDPDERYWPAVLARIVDLASGAAAGAHAEGMRLARIEAIAADPLAPADIRDVFARILPQERFHERAFRELAGEEALQAAEDAHEIGRIALGLAP